MADQLLPFEKLVTRVHRHPMVLLAQLLAPLGMVLVVLAVDYLNRALIPQDVMLLVTLAVIALAGLWVIGAWVGWTSKSFTLTNQRVILNEGIFTRTTKVIPLERVQDVSTRQTMFGRIFDYGLVAIDATGTTERMENMPNPNRFRDQVFVQVRREPKPTQEPAS